MQDNTDNKIEQWMERSAEELRVNPSEEAWSKLQTELGKPRQKGIRFQLVWKIAAAVAFLLASAAILINLDRFAGTNDISALSKRSFRVSNIDISAYSTSYQKAFDAWIIQAKNLDHRRPVD